MCYGGAIDPDSGGVFSRRWYIPINGSCMENPDITHCIAWRDNGPNQLRKSDTRSPGLCRKDSTYKMLILRNPTVQVGRSRNMSISDWKSINTPTKHPPQHRPIQQTNTTYALPAHSGSPLRLRHPPPHRISPAVTGTITPSVTSPCVANVHVKPTLSTHGAMKNGFTNADRFSSTL